VRIRALEVGRYEAVLDGPMRSRGAPGFTEFFHTGSERQVFEPLAISTDEGLTGWSWSAGRWGEYIARVAGPVLQGVEAPEDDEAIAALRHRLEAAGVAAGLAVGAARGLARRTELALWDLAARVAGLPVARLWGAAEGPLVAQVYAGGGCLCWNPTAELLAEAAETARAGHTRLKIKIGHGPEEDASIVRALRHAVGPELELMVDANCAYDVESALRLCDTLRECEVKWFEEPLPQECRQGYRRLRREGGVPIAGGEGFSELAQLQVALAEEMLDIFQGDGAGFGAQHLLTAARLCFAAGVKVTPHACNNAAALAVGVHLQAAIPNGAAQELDTFPSPFLQDVYRGAFHVRHGQVGLDAPGWGLEPDRERLARYAAAGAS
jgi:L-alanine-DL-glutamate epimerase-like enolase superfamily enzyme